MLIAFHSLMYGRRLVISLQETLWETEERYRAFFENSFYAMFITSPEGKIETANAEACRMFGMSEAELIKEGQKRDGENA